MQAPTPYFSLAVKQKNLADLAQENVKTEGFALASEGSFVDTLPRKRNLLFNESPSTRQAFINTNAASQQSTLYTL